VVVESPLGTGNGTLTKDDLDAARNLHEDNGNINSINSVLQKDTFLYSEECNSVVKSRTIYEGFIADDDDSQQMMMHAMKFQERKSWIASGVKVELLDHFHVAVINPPLLNDSTDGYYVVEISSPSFTFTPSRQQSKLDLMKTLTKTLSKVNWLD